MPFAHALDFAVMRASLRSVRESGLVMPELQREKCSPVLRAKNNCHVRESCAPHNK